ncbi:MAG: DUF5618 family protein, partial [Dysgonamonadaceae bacterium]|nr:DUF5618 family protein [Dysgonamonadaceae bacterium]
TACGTAYNGVLIALDAYLLLKGVEQKKGRKSIQYYTMHVSAIDKKMLKYLNSAYATLHIAGYYEGVPDARVVNAGFDVAYSIIKYIKPDYVQEPAQELPQSRPSLLRRIYSFFA